MYNMTHNGDPFWRMHYKEIWFKATIDVRFPIFVEVPISSELAK